MGKINILPGPVSRMMKKQKISDEYFLQQSGMGRMLFTIFWDFRPFCLRG